MDLQQKDNPDEEWIRKKIKQIAAQTEAEMNIAKNGVFEEIVIFELPDEDRGRLKLYIDPDREDSFISLEHPSEPNSIDIDVSDELSRLTFDIRPHEDQYRIQTSGKTSIDFGL